MNRDDYTIIFDNGDFTVKYADDGGDIHWLIADLQDCAFYLHRDAEAAIDLVIEKLDFLQWAHEDDRKQCGWL